MSLLIVGTVAFDEVETPFGKTGKILGGAGTYIGLAASHLTDQISIVSVVGGDFPKKYLDLFREKNIDTTGLKVVEDGKTFFWAGKYHLDMNTRDTLVTDLNVLADFDPVVPQHARNSKYLMLGNLTPSIQKRVIEQMETRPKLIVMDTMNFWMNIAWDDLMEVLTMVDVLTINDEEARQLSGEHSLMKAAKKILTMGPRYLIVKKGEHGALLFYENQVFFAPAMILENVFDPTGAGDTFAGGFLGYIARKDDTSFETLKNALIYGSAMASFTVEKFGTDRLLEITGEDIEERLLEFVKMVAFKI
ncbi:MAG: bifunctional hydroxymethylpyrimidine kinase/phosphomethylpyrimidine kinase [Bacteroidales bacterium]|nr:bifunctional hydroxymethylpyrimidine kinase/phosphomethylpyrimidine kinase [Bacteroidales bacterium]